MQPDRPDKRSGRRAGSPHPPAEVPWSAPSSEPAIIIEELIEAAVRDAVGQVLARFLGSVGIVIPSLVRDVEWPGTGVGGEADDRHVIDGDAGLVQDDIIHGRSRDFPMRTARRNRRLGPGEPPWTGTIGLDGNLVVPVPEAARLLGISRSHAYELVRRDELASVRLGRRIVVPMRVIDRMLDSATKRSA